MIVIRQKEFARFLKRNPQFEKKALTGFERACAKNKTKVEGIFRMSEESWKKGEELENRLFKKHKGDWSKLTEKERKLLDKYSWEGGAIAHTQHQGSDPKISQGYRRKDMKTAMTTMVRRGGAYRGYNSHELPYDIEVPIQLYRGEYKNGVPRASTIAKNIRDARQTYKALPTLNGEGRRTARVQELRNANRQKLGLD